MIEIHPSPSSAGTASQSAPHNHRPEPHCQHQSGQSETEPGPGELISAGRSVPLAPLSTSAVNRSWTDLQGVKSNMSGAAERPSDRAAPELKQRDLDEAQRDVGPDGTATPPPSHDTTSGKSAVNPGTQHATSATQRLGESHLARTPKRHRTPSPDSETAGTSPRQGLSLLLGQGFSSWPHSDSSLAEALRLKAEQERTKQEFYRLENRKRSLELLNYAVRAGIPGSAIPILFGSSAASPGSMEGAQQHQNAPASVLNPQAMAHIPQQSPPRNTHSSSGSGLTASSASAAPSSAGPSTGQAITSPQVEIVNFETQRSPTRFRPGHARSASAISYSAPRPVTSSYYGRPPAPGGGNIQFHHWKPEQQVPKDKTTASPRRDDRRDERRSTVARDGPPLQPSMARASAASHAHSPDQSSSQPPQHSQAASMHQQLQQRSQPPGGHAAQAQPPQHSQGRSVPSAQYPGPSQLQTPNQPRVESAMLETKSPKVVPNSTPGSSAAQASEPPPFGSPMQSEASIVAAQNSRRRSMGGHVRHRSEAVPPKFAWYGRSDEGVSILANMASERTKHDVGFILDSGTPQTQQPDQQSQVQPGGASPEKPMAKFAAVPGAPGQMVNTVSSRTFNQAVVMPPQAGYFGPGSGGNTAAQVAENHPPAAQGHGSPK